MTSVQILIVTVLLQQGFFGVLWLGAAWLRMAPRAALHWSATTMLLGLSMASLIGHDALDPAVGRFLAYALNVIAFAVARRGVRLDRLRLGGREASGEVGPDARLQRDAVSHASSSRRWRRARNR